MSRLFDLGKKYETDKVYRCATHDISTLEIYDHIFSNQFDTSSRLNILEIGVRSGASIRMMLEYFPNSQIYGLDIVCGGVHGFSKNKYKGIDDISKERFTFIKGNQHKKEDLNKVLSLCSSFDIIIDDGSHLIDDYVYSYEHLISFLNKGGVYIIEDLYNNYTFWNKSKTTSGNKDGARFNEFYSRLNYNIHKGRQVHNPNSSPIFSVQTMPGLMIVKKGI